MRIAIMGAGSLGIVIGGLMAAAGRDVVLVANEKSVAALKTRGAVLKGAVEATIPVNAVTPDEMTGCYDCVFLLTKRDANAVALQQLLPHLHDNSVVCTLQNGVPEEEVADAVGPARTVGGVVLVGATRLEPGVSLITSSTAVLRDYAFAIGETDGRKTSRIEALQEVLSCVGGCRVVDNLTSIRWSKLLVNATVGAMTAALGCICRDILEDSRAMDLVAHIADETIRTAHACGSRLAALQGKDLEFLELRPGDTPADKWNFYREYFGAYAETKGSILQDLENGRKTEIEYINGYICRKGREKGIPTPYNDLIVQLVKTAEETGRLPDFETNLQQAATALQRKR